MSFWIGFVIGGATCGASVFVGMCCLFMAKDRDPHAIKRGENPWNDFTSGCDL